MCGVSTPRARRAPRTTSIKVSTIRYDPDEVRTTRVPIRHHHRRPLDLNRNIVDFSLSFPHTRLSCVLFTVTLLPTQLHPGSRSSSSLVLSMVHIVDERGPYSARGTVCAQVNCPYRVSVLSVGVLSSTNGRTSANMLDTRVRHGPCTFLDSLIVSSFT